MSFTRNHSIRNVLSLIVITVALTACGGDESTSATDKTLEIYETSASLDTSTDSSGLAVLDSSSFNHQIYLDLKDANDDPVQSANVAYEQNEGLVKVQIVDVSKTYSPAVIYVDLNNYQTSDKEVAFLPIQERLKTHLASIGLHVLKIVVNDANAVVITVPIGIILGITGGLSFYNGFETGGKLYELVDYTLDEVSETSLNKTTLETTLGEFVGQVPNLASVVSLPIGTLENVLEVKSGKLVKLSMKKFATKTVSEFIEGEIEAFVLAYAAEQLPEYVGANTPIRVTIYHFSLLDPGRDRFFAIEVLDEQVEPENGLIAHYEFNGDTQDSSRNGNHAVANGDIAFGMGTAYINNPSGSALASQYMSLPYSSSIQALETSSFTINICFKTNDDAQLNGRLFGNGSGSPTGVVIDYNAGSQTHAYSQLEDISNNSFYPGFNISDPTPAIVTDGLDHCIALVLDRDSNAVKQYVDGVEVDSLDVSGLTDVSMNGLVLGAAKANDTYGARDTLVNDLRLYNRALNVNEIADIYLNNTD